jgi:hypothetical protein
MRCPRSESKVAVNGRKFQTEAVPPRAAAFRNLSDMVELFTGTFFQFTAVPSITIMRGHEHELSRYALR